MKTYTQLQQKMILLQILNSIMFVVIGSSQGASLKSTTSPSMSQIQSHSPTPKIWHYPLRATGIESSTSRIKEKGTPVSLSQSSQSTEQSFSTLSSSALSSSLIEAESITTSSASLNNSETTTTSSAPTNKLQSDTITTDNPLTTKKLTRVTLEKEMMVVPEDTSENLTKRISDATKVFDTGQSTISPTEPPEVSEQIKSVTTNMTGSDSPLLNNKRMNSKIVTSSKINSLEKSSEKKLKGINTTIRNKKKFSRKDDISISSYNPFRNFRKSSEVVSSKTKPIKFLAMLRNAQQSGNFVDPFSVSSILQEDSFDKLLATDSSSFNEGRNKFLRSSVYSLNPVYEATSSYHSFKNASASNKTSNVSGIHLNNSEDSLPPRVNSEFSTQEPANDVHSSVVSFVNTVGVDDSRTKGIKTTRSPHTTNDDSLKEIQKTTNSYSSNKKMSNMNQEEKNIEINKAVDFSFPLKFSIKIENVGSKKNEVSQVLSPTAPSFTEEITSTTTAPSSENLEQFNNRVRVEKEQNRNEMKRLKEHYKERKKEIFPIYEELVRPLHVDSSIDDIEEDEPKNPKLTENSDTYFAKINTSIINVIEPDLKFDSQHTRDVNENTITTEILTTQTPTTLKISEASTSSDSEFTTTLNNINETNNGAPITIQSSTSQPSTNLTLLSSPTNISSQHSLNSTRSNFVKDQDTFGIRKHDKEEPESNQELYDETYYNIFGFNGNWNMHTKTKQIDPNLIKKHNDRVLEVQAVKMLQVMNESVDPCEDFYEYACGKWSEVYPLEDKALDNTFDRLREGLDEVLKSMLEEQLTEKDTNATKAAKILYKACMDEEKIEERGSQPLKMLLKDLGGWPVLEGSNWNESDFNWVELMAVLRNYNNDILLSEWVAADITNSSYHIIQLDQPELGLPGREYFISSGDQAYRRAYMDLMMKSCELLGGEHSLCLEDMLDVLFFEQQLAKILTPAEERRNLSAVHQRLTVGGLEKEIPQIDWRRYLKIVSGQNETDKVIVFAMKYIKKMIRLIDNTKKRTVSNYLLWRFVKNRISNLGQEALKAKQEFIHVLFGSKSQPERWHFCVSYVNGNLGYAVGSLFVKKYYPESSKNDSEVMIELIRESFMEAVRNATWMTSSTRKVAEEKVQAIVRNVGYPEYILNDTYMDAAYSNLKFNESEHFMNVIQMLRFHAQNTHSLLLKPVNRTEWTTTPAVVNAYYSRSKNMIMFPAGILQPPFYHPAFPRSLNFGGIGVVIGHEISHGFDDRGRQFDSTGNLKQWWTEEDVSQFYDRATCMLDQYGEYEVKSVGLKINAINTLGENIADNAGLKIAYKAYHKWKIQNGGETSSLPNINLTYDQLFFLNFGQIWCEVNSPKAMLTKIRGGQHSPNRYRVIGTLSNSDEFNEAFNCPKGKGMNPEHKCKVW